MSVVVERLADSHLTSPQSTQLSDHLLPRVPVTVRAQPIPGNAESLGGGESLRGRRETGKSSDLREHREIPAATLAVEFDHVDRAADAADEPDSVSSVQVVDPSCAGLGGPARFCGPVEEELLSGAGQNSGRADRRRTQGSVSGPHHRRRRCLQNDAVRADEDYVVRAPVLRLAYRGHVHRVRQRLHAAEQPGRLRECGSGEAAVQRDHSQPIPALLPDRLGQGAHRKQPGGYAVGRATRQDEFQSVLTRRSARVECGIDEGAPGRLIELDVERGRRSPHPGKMGRQLVDRTAASGVGLDPAALEAPVAAVDAAVVRPHYRTIRIDESFSKNAQDKNGHRAQGRGASVLRGHPSAPTIDVMPIDPDLATRLRARGLRMTSKRDEVLQAVRRLGHATPEQISAAVPDIDVTTVYRTLELLEEIGLVRHTHLGHGAPSFRPADDDHIHVICHACGRVVDAPQNLTDELAARLAREQGFVLDRAHFAVFGRCRDCVASPPPGSEQYLVHDHVSAGSQ